MQKPGDKLRDPADRIEPGMVKDSDAAGVPLSGRASNAGGNLSETSRSRDPDLDDEVG